MTHDYKRHGTTTLFAALNVHEGTVIGERDSIKRECAEQEYGSAFPAVRVAILHHRDSRGQAAIILP
jgi:hypothetical protein